VAPVKTAFHVVPPIEHFGHFDGLAFPNEPARHLVGFCSSVAFDLDRGEFHSSSGYINPEAGAVSCRFPTKLEWSAA
jgi:hypothetical protein